MLNWYKDSDIGIFFNIKPNVEMRYICPYDSEEVKKDVSKKPFVNKEELKVVLCDYLNFNTYSFIIPKNYCWDGATIPRLFWRLIGAKTDSSFLIPSLIHDVLCENHHYVNYDRYFSTRVFERLLYVSNVSSFNRWIMFHSVDNFQKFCGWGK